MSGAPEFTSARARNRHSLWSSSPRCLLPHHGFILPKEPISILTLEFPLLAWWDEVPLVPLSLPTVTFLSPLRSCDLGLSAETHFLADFPLDWEKPVSCQDIWGGTENTLYFPDVILSACLSHMELGEGCHWLLLSLWMAFPCCQDSACSFSCCPGRCASETGFECSPRGTQDLNACFRMYSQLLY